MVGPILRTSERKASNLSDCTVSVKDCQTLSKMDQSFSSKQVCVRRLKHSDLCLRRYLNLGWVIKLGLGQQHFASRLQLSLALKAAVPEGSSSFSVKTFSRDLALLRTRTVALL